MQMASEMHPSGIMTVMCSASTKLHLVLEKAREYASVHGVENPICEVSHYLYPQCKMVAGHKEVGYHITFWFRLLKAHNLTLILAQGESYQCINTDISY